MRSSRRVLPDQERRRLRNPRILVALGALLLLVAAIRATGLFSSRNENRTGEYATAGFDLLGSYPVALDGEGRWPGEIPPRVKALDNQAVAVTGFMMPIDFVEGSDRATAFLLLKDQSSCCFGAEPAPNSYVVISASDSEGTEVVMDVPIVVQGTIQIGADYVGEGLRSLYRMNADHILIPDEDRDLLGTTRGLQERLLKRTQNTSG
jgi:hypothetical protein